jgi:hypothetical protein
MAEELRANRAELCNALATYPSGSEPVHTCEGHAKPVENSRDSREVDRAARGQLVAALLLVNVLLVIVVIVAVLT